MVSQWFSEPCAWIHCCKWPNYDVCIPQVVQQQL